MLFRAEADEKSVIYKKMQSLVDTPSMISITRDSWRHIQTLWQQLELLVGFSMVRQARFHAITVFLRKYHFSSDVALALVIGFGVTGRIRGSWQVAGESRSSLALGQRHTGGDDGGNGEHNLEQAGGPQEILPRSASHGGEIPARQKLATGSASSTRTAEQHVSALRQLARSRRQEEGEAKVLGAQVLPGRVPVPRGDQVEGLEREIRHGGEGTPDVGAISQLCLAKQNIPRVPEGLLGHAAGRRGVQARRRYR